MEVVCFFEILNLNQSMKKSLVFTYLFLHFISINAQVGINTETPQTTLDVNGSMQLRKDLSVGGSAGLTGSSGNYGQVIISEGKELNPKWKNTKVPFLEDGQYQLINSHSQIDQSGISFPAGAAVGGNISNTGETLNSNWTVIDGLTTVINVKSSENKISLIFQAGVELSQTSSSNQNVKFICAAFFNNVLRALRADQIDAISGKQKNQSLYTLAYTVLDLPVENYEVKLACRKISTTNNDLRLAVGRNSEGAGTQQTNPFTMQSVLKIDLIEKVNYTY